MNHQSPLQWVSFQAIVVVLAAISAVYLQMENFADDPGVGWHLRTGAWVIENREVPRIDPFLAPTPEVPRRQWVSDQWLSDVLLAWMFELGSWPLVYAILAALYLGIYFGVLLAAVRISGASTFAALFAVMCAFKVGQIHFILRPVMMSFLCFAVVVLLLVQSSRRPTQLTGRRAIWALLPWAGLFVLWANLHPAFVLGLLVLGLWLVVRAVSIVLGQRSLGDLMVPLGICVVSSAATLLNPYFLELHRSILSLGTSDYFMSLHEEWMPIQLSSPEGRFWILIVALGGVGMTLAPRAWSEARVTLTCASGIFALWCFDAVRMVPFLGIAAAIPVAYSLDTITRRVAISGVVSRSPLYSKIVSAMRKIERRESASHGATKVWVAVSVVLVVSSLTFKHLVIFRGPFGPSPERYPYQGIELIQASAEPKKVVVAAPPGWGGFITFQGKGTLTPLIDDRNTLVGEEFYREFDQYLEAAPGWAEFFNRLGASFVLLPTNGAIARNLSEDIAPWKIRLKDEVQLVLSKD
jgi:hypothetical protein